jgi:ribosomal protein S18 acetylase RimI-like enzyme
MSAVPGARRATDADVAPLAQTLARAFYDDPVAMWAFRHDELRPDALERFQATRVRQLLGEEEVWMAEDHACAALWAPPGRWRTTLRQDAALLRAFTHPRLVSRLGLVALGLLDVERKHPHDPPHYYLAMLGTHPDHQGQGLGSALMRPVLERCDADGVGAFLESSKERNVDFYARHGFRVVQEIRLPRGPRMWQMWRDPLP